MQTEPGKAVSAGMTDFPNRDPAPVKRMMEDKVQPETVDIVPDARNIAVGHPDRAG